MYKFLYELDDVCWYRGPDGNRTTYNTRGNRYRLRREVVKNCLPRHNFLTNRVVNDWNNLSNEVIESKSINLFKNNLDILLKD